MVSLPVSVRVLNVNDNPSARYIATKVLRRAGFEVFEAETGLAALREARLQLPHVAVLDVRLPDLSGIDVCRQLKADPATASILIIQTSASFVSSANKAEGLSAGADAYLAQPFEAEELVATVHSLLRGRRQETEARQRAEALTEADQRKDEFLAMLAHELRNPLSAILTASRLLQAKDGPSTPRLASTIERQANHLASLVDDLLDVSRITRGKIQLKLAPLDLREAVQRALETCRAPFDKRRQDVRLVLPEAPIHVSADAVRLEQILCNLFSNAAKYTADRGRVDIVVERVVVQSDAPRARVVVHDSGVGLSKEDKEHVFDLFYQVDATLARSQSGLGIGLTMVKRLVELHEGNIEVSSDGRGHGSSFAIDFAEDLSAEAPLAAEGKSGSIKGVRVLLVDDNEDACELMQFCLEDEGCRAQTAFDGGEALRVALDRTFDVVVLDIGLPVLDGYQVASALCEKLGPRRPKLIALTGYGRAEDRGRALRAGFDCHLVKPTDPSALVRAIADLARDARVRVG